MRIATVKEFRDKASTMFRSHEPLLITRRGKVAGLYLPLDEVDQFPFDLRKDLQQALASSVRQGLEERGLNEEEILEDFERFRKQTQHSSP